MTALQSDDCQPNDPNNSFPMTIDSLRFPLDTSMRIVFTGHFNGFSVVVRSEDEMALLHQMGCFGKGSLSRSKPKLNQGNSGPQIMRKRQFHKRNYWYKKFCDTTEKESDLFLKEAEELSGKIIHDCKSKLKDVIDLVSSDEDNSDGEDFSVRGGHDSYNKDNMVVIVPNSDSEEENYCENLKPQCCINKTKIEEKLMLTLEEAFFLSYGLGCLQVVKGDKLLNIQQCWQLFSDTDRNFIFKYVVYHYYRSKGYVVKPGLKFGGDYLLYKDGPGVTHGEFIVVIRNGVENCDWIPLLGHIRMATTTGKEIIIAEIMKFEDIVKLPEQLNKYSVREMLLTREIPVALNEDID